MRGWILHPSSSRAKNRIYNISYPNKFCWRLWQESGELSLISPPFDFTVNCILGNIWLEFPRFRFEVRYINVVQTRVIRIFAQTYSVYAVKAAEDEKQTGSFAFKYPNKFCYFPPSKLPMDILAVWGYWSKFA